MEIVGGLGGGANRLLKGQGCLRLSPLFDLTFASNLTDDVAEAGKS